MATTRRGLFIVLEGLDGAGTTTQANELVRRLRDAFELDRHGVALAMTLMRRIEELEMELTAVRARLCHGMSNPG